MPPSHFLCRIWIDDRRETVASLLKVRRRDWCNPKLVQRIRSRIHEHITGIVQLSLEECDSLDDELIESCPDVDRSPNFDAVSACQALEHVLRSAQTESESASYAASVAEVALENTGSTTDFEDDDDPEFWLQPDVKREVAAQQRVLKYLKGIRTLGQAEVVEAIRLATTDG